MAHYLDEAQRQALARRATSWRWRSEWPTWLLIAAVHASWFGVALHAATRLAAGRHAVDAREHVVHVVAA
jgi:hypothetical protein